MLFLIVLVVGVLWVVSESFKFSPISRTAQVGLPTYSLIMAVVSLVRDPSHWPWLFLAIPCGMVIGWFQTTGVQVRQTDERDRRGRRITQIRRGGRYALGWALVFVVGICFHVALEGSMPWDDILNDLAKDVARDLFSILMFTTGVSWYVWAISGAAGYTYSLWLRLTDVAVAEALHDAPVPGHEERYRRRGIQRAIDETWRLRGHGAQATDGTEESAAEKDVTEKGADIAGGGKGRS